MSIKNGIRRLMKVTAVIISQILPYYISYTIVSNNRRLYISPDVTEIITVQLGYLLLAPIIYYLLLCVEKVIMWVYKGFKEEGE